MNPSSYLVTCLVAIALIATPTILPLQFPSITHAQTNSLSWSNLFDQARNLENADQYLEAENVYRQILSAPQPASLPELPTLRGSVEIQVALVIVVLVRFVKRLFLCFGSW
ncbi:MAG: hypothetical protein HC916_07285 [Coleofasciculaceae cyanobacterium SM2_1_6]|nr:hypothetical protein [Coleofasciculaceae cyanobacterium SM2_1_6]